MASHFDNCKDYRTHQGVEEGEGVGAQFLNAKSDWLPQHCETAVAVVKMVADVGCEYWASVD